VLVGEGRVALRDVRGSPLAVSPLLSGQSLRRAVVYTVRASFQFRQPPPVTRQVVQNDELSFHITIAPCAFETLKRAALIGLG
jgi:hypothetical protein